MAQDYDLVVLGAGTGGYVAAIRAAQLGMKVAIVEKEKLGGTCLHKGCIPSKALLRSAEVFATAKNSEEFGVLSSDVKVDFSNVQSRKQKVVNQLYQGVQHLMKKWEIDSYEGTGRILGSSIFSPSPGTISVEMNNGEDNQILIPKYVVIATGSRPKRLGSIAIDGERIMTSNEALLMNELPSSIIIIGGGVIGVEWASMLADFGVEVTVLEAAEGLLPGEDHEISEEAERLLKKKGITIVTKATVSQSRVHDDEVVITAERKEETKHFRASKVLVSIGRVANVEGIGLENTDIVVRDGVIETNEWYQTKESHIYAIGDVIGGMQLAHVASREGVVAVEHIANLKPTPIDYRMVPKCTYSRPEVASVGYTEEEAIAKGFRVKAGKFSFKAIAKALIIGEPAGFVKLVIDEQTEDLLGVHMIGSHVTELISEGTLARVLDATPWEISQTIHPHPSLSEAINEASLAVDGKAIHL